MPNLTTMKTYALLLFLILYGLISLAQNKYTLSGTILNESSEPIEAATVFIDGSKLITQTDANGRYTFLGLTSGGYHIVVNMIGYGSLKQDILINDKSINLNIKLVTKEQNLREVVIVGDGSRPRYLNVFKRYFLGESVNASGCTILNPDILNFTTKGKILFASTNEFLIIDNVNLGYRIKYLLKDFQFNEYLETTGYVGQCIFEELEGSSKQIDVWQKNRENAYYGSLMHYLRSIYKGTAQSEGFLTYKVTNERLPIEIEAESVSNLRLIKKVDSNFINLKFKQRHYIIYDKKLASQNYSFRKNQRTIYELNDVGSIFKTNGNIDFKGNNVNYTELLVQGYWGRKRIGDQLPFEYIPL